METLFYNRCCGNTDQPPEKPHQKNNFSTLNQDLQAVTSSKLSTNYDYLLQNYTAILHTSMTVLELMIFLKPDFCLGSRI